MYYDTGRKASLKRKSFTKCQAEVSFFMVLFSPRKSRGDRVLETHRGLNISHLGLIKGSASRVIVISLSVS